MNRYVAEQIDQAGKGVVARTVEADGYAWSQGGTVSFQRRKEATPDVVEMETFATLFNVVAVFEDGTVSV